MTTATKRKKLHDFINAADDKKVEAIYLIVQDEFTEKLEVTDSSKVRKLDFIKQASSDPLFLADLKEISEDFSAVDNENI